MESTMIQIDIDEEVFEALKKRAEPFVDTPNSVLRRALGVDQGGSQTAALGSTPEHATFQIAEARRKRTKPRSRKGRSRAPAGSLLPETEYVDPILRAIAAKGGRAPTREVVAEVGIALADQLTPLDQEKMTSGVVRWHNRVQFTRLRMVEQGLLKRGSPRGVWEISEEGLRRIEPGSAA
jgi:hypothetical protein